MRWASRSRGCSNAAAARANGAASGDPREWAAAIRSRLAEHAPRATLTYDEAINLVCEATGWPVGHVWVHSATGWRSSGAWRSPDDPARATGYAALRDATALTDLGSGRGIVAAVLHLESCRFLPGLDGLGSSLREERAAALGLRAVVGVPARLSVGGQRVGAVLEFITAAEIEPDGELAQSLLDVAERARRRVVRKVTTAGRTPTRDVELGKHLGDAPDHLAG